METIIEKIEKAVAELKSEYSYTQNFSKKSYFNGTKIWKKENNNRIYFRIYVARNAYETAGYIAVETFNENTITNDVEESNICMKTYESRPGNLSVLIDFVMDLNEKLEKNIILYDKKNNILKGK